MIKTEMMKRYEAETDEIATWRWHDREFLTDDYIAWLEAQLRWRPVGEKPEEEGKYWLRRGESNISVLLYKDGSWWYFDNDIRNEYVEFNFKYAGKYAPTHWLPIPPAPEGEKK